MSNTKKIGEFHFIIAYTVDGDKPIWGHKPIYGYCYHLELEMHQALTKFLGSEVWINVNRSTLTFS